MPVVIMTGAQEEGMESEKVCIRRRGGGWTEGFHPDFMTILSPGLHFPQSFRALAACNPSRL